MSTESRPECSGSKSHPFQSGRPRMEIKSTRGRRSSHSSFTASCAGRGREGGMTSWAPPLLLRLPGGRPRGCFVAEASLLALAPKDDASLTELPWPPRSPRPPRLPRGQPRSLFGAGLTSPGTARPLFFSDAKSLFGAIWWKQRKRKKTKE
jgi:hypothetical protein